MTELSGDNSGFATARAQTSLSVEQLWMRYFQLGGRADPLELDAFLSGALPWTNVERDVLAHALNEELEDLGATGRLPYSFDRDSR